MKFSPIRYVTAAIPALIPSIFVMSCNDESGNNSTTAPTTAGSDSGALTTTTSPGITPSDSTGSTLRTKRKGKASVKIVEAEANAKMEADKQGYYNHTEVLPAYKGGHSALENYITNNIEYPQDAIDNNVEGTVSVQFGVDEQGNISNVKVIGNKIGHGLEEEAVRVVSKMPKWSPGQVKGKNVKTLRTLPITYRLES